MLISATLGIKGLILLCLGLLSAALTFVTNWLALIPWRKTRNQHWTERARAYYPVRIAATSNIWVVPALLTITTPLFWPEVSPHWMLIVVVTIVGAILGTIPMDREVFSRIPFNDLLRQVALGWLTQFFVWFGFLALIAFMPNRFSLNAMVLAAVAIVLGVVWIHDGAIRVARKLGMLLPPPPRLQKIVDDTAARMGVEVRDVLLMRVSLAQAFAMPHSRRLLFTERLMDLLSDAEIAAVCTHELAHLTEAPSEYYKRYVVWMTFVPWVFVKPMAHTFGALGVLVLLLTTILAPLVYRRVSHKLEVRADRIAHTNEPDAGTYARALARLYEDNLAPAVQARDHATHPHLYDRLIAAGMPPDYPRPAAAKSMAWHGRLFAGAIGLVAAFFILRLPGFISAEKIQSWFQ